MTPLKFCPYRHHMVPRSEFAANWMTRDGKQHWCKSCQALHRAIAKAAKPVTA